MMCTSQKCLLNFPHASSIAVLISSFRSRQPAELNGDDSLFAARDHLLASRRLHNIGQDAQLAFSTSARLKSRGQATSGAVVIPDHRRDSSQAQRSRSSMRREKAANSALIDAKRNCIAIPIPAD